MIGIDIGGLIWPVGQTDFGARPGAMAHLTSGHLGRLSWTTLII
jgi:hypothetical protein